MLNARQSMSFNDIEAPPDASTPRPHKEFRAMRPSHLIARDARPEDPNDLAAAVLSAWLAPRESSRRRLVPDFKRLMKLD
jgi:hypothetical protein